MPVARNDSELINILLGSGIGKAHSNSGPVAIALDYVLKQIMARNKELVQKIVYDKYSPEVYERTGEFKEAWDYIMQVKGNKIEGTFFGPSTNPDLIPTVNPMLGQHASPTENGPEWWYDAREYLAEVIYQGNHNGLFGRGPWANKRDVWKPLIDTVDSKATSTWFLQGLKLAGLKVR